MKEKKTYAFNNPLAYSATFCIDLILKVYPGQCRGSIPTSPKRLLLCNAGHLGDMILSTSVLPLIKEVLPLVKIGFLSGSWTEEFWQNHPFIDKLHILDHWKTNRSSFSFFAKYKRYNSLYKKALREVVSENYDLAIDLRFHYPTFSYFLWQAKIPCRIGYTSAGFGPLLTHPRPWVKRSQSTAKSFRDLLPFSTSQADFQASFPIPKEQREPFIIIHMGCGDPRRTWPLQKWLSLTEKLLTKGYTLFFTGKGAKEKEAADSLCRLSSSCKNFADQLSLQEWIHLIAKAKLLIGVESSAGHLAAATDTPSVLFYKNLEETWKPLSEKAYILPLHCEAEDGFEAAILQDAKYSL